MCRRHAPCSSSSTSFPERSTYALGLASDRNRASHVESTGAESARARAVRGLQERVDMSLRSGWYCPSRCVPVLIPDRVRATLVDDHELPLTTTVQQRHKQETGTLTTTAQHGLTPATKVTSPRQRCGLKTRARMSARMAAPHRSRRGVGWCTEHGLAAFSWYRAVRRPLGVDAHELYHYGTIVVAFGLYATIQ